MNAAAVLRDEDAVLQILIVAVVAITIVALIFALVAIGIRMVSDRRAKSESRLFDMWTEPVLDALANPVGAPFRHRIRKVDRLLFLEFLARMSVALSRDERQQLAVIAEPYLRDAEGLLADRDPEFRALGVQLIGLLGAGSHRGLLSRYMADRSPLVALTAIRALSRAGHPDDLEKVLQQLPRFEKWGRTLLSTLLASFGDVGRPILRDVLADSEKPERHRVAAAGALVKLHDLESADLAARILQSSPGRELSAACLRLIKRLGRPVQAGLLAHLASSDDPVIRLHAVGALAAIATDDDVDVVTMAVSDPSRWVAMRATRALRDLNRLDRLKQLSDIGHARAGLAREHLKEEASNA